ncbi:MAG: VCBS repeat-containing protein [Candidatus Sulfobium sp.]
MVQGKENPFENLKQNALSYFRVLSGTVTGVEGHNVVLSLGEKDSVRPGMRLKVLREDVPFIHPVTGEVVGKVEAAVGKIEIRDVGPDSSSGVLVEGQAKQGDRVRLSDARIKMMFCQEKDVDWYLADEYYRKLKETGRVQMLDTGLETDDVGKVLAEARRLGAEVALLLTAKGAKDGTLLRERLFWVSDGSKFVDAETTVDTEYSKNLKFGQEYFVPQTGEPVMSFNLPFKAGLVTVGDVAGDGKKEIILSDGNSLRVYALGVDLKFLWEIKGSATDDFIWLDSVDVDKDGKDEIVGTSMKNGEVLSYIYEFTGSGFKRMWKGKYFVRRIGNGLAAQQYSASQGFKGKVFSLNWASGGCVAGKPLNIPKGVNIYDFITMKGPSGESLVLAYDDQGFLNLYNGNGLRVWRSRKGTGGFLTTFRKESVGTILEPGEWAIKDRLAAMRKEVLVIDRKPLTGVAKGLGYTSSSIRNYWWNGFSMEQGELIDGVDGSLLDYALSGDEVIVLASPFMGIKFENILKGENPLGTVLYVYLVKGR